MLAIPIKETAQALSVPAPSSGINASSNLSMMQPSEALYLYNLNPTRYGCRVRPGWREWATNLTGIGGVRTVISVRGGTTAGIQNYLFACTADGIWDCSLSTSAPTKIVSFGITTGNAGWGTYTHVTNAAGEVYILYCDELNGYYTFDTSTDTWLKVTMGGGGSQVSGVDPATFVSVSYYAGRVWFVQAGTGTAWYLVAGSLYGAATQFLFGAEFSHGGNLNSLWTFTYESVYYIAEYLVAVGDAGDLTVWQGTDPDTAANFGIRGKWWLGELPAGRRVATSYGGDLIILCQFGAMSVSNLLSGVDVANPDSFITQKIAPAISADVIATAGLRGWDIVPWPAENAIFLLEPKLVGQPPKQFIYNLATKGWGVYKDLDIQCAAIWQSNLYSGTADGRVLIHTGNQDAIKLDGSGGININWGALGAFQNAQTPGKQKAIDFIRAILVGDTGAIFKAFIRFNYDISDLVGSPTGTPPSMGGWDSGIWDSAIWGGGGFNAMETIVGNFGMGSSFAVGIIGSSYGSNTLVGYELSGRVGGFL